VKSNQLAFICLFSFAVFTGACNQATEIPPQGTSLFSLLDTKSTGIQFANQLDYTEELNPYTFRNFFNGGGVGLGDVNNDGLIDIFFSGNMVPNKLYLNKGGFKFEDISVEAGIGSDGVWTTGVSLVDINGDGWLDIYICKSGPVENAIFTASKRHNELLINNGPSADGLAVTFTESSVAYGLAEQGLSTHAAFFDFDNDGDLDVYLLNNSMRVVGGYDLRKDQRKIPDPDGGNKLYRNDSGKFTDVSQRAGIYTSAIGFGLGVTIGDIDKDGWLDIYVSNDFFEKDYLYINNQDGTFTESLESLMREISMGSMGADMADINNDGLPEVFVTEMLPNDDGRLKTKAQFEKWDKYQASVAQGYYHQFGRNALQLNNGPDADGKLSFSEISRLAGVEATDWSWGALIFDMNNDGYKDIFVANGIYKDLLDQDYVNFIGDPAVVRNILLAQKNVIKQLIDSIPSNRIPNYAFQNLGGIQFKNSAEEWGMDLPSHSNGSAYGDLDNDGDLDLVLNNVNMPATIYENKSTEFYPHHHYLTVSLTGEGMNSFALGSKVVLYAGDQVFYQELAPMRGFMSSVDPRIHFGLGGVTTIDSLVVDWPGGTSTTLRNIQVNQSLQVTQQSDTPIVKKTPARTEPLFTPSPSPKGVSYRHQESSFVDFDRERLLFNMVSNEGPCTCVADVNGDGLDDFFIGGAKGQSGALFVQKKAGGFTELSGSTLEQNAGSEDTGCQFFDANGDGLPDLYVTSGSNEDSNMSLSLLDRLYMNKGNGQFEKSSQIFPSPSKLESTSVVKAADYDDDGDLDLFVGGRVAPNGYGNPRRGYLLNNDGKGNFTDVTIEIASGLMGLGMITDAAWMDFDGDNAPDLVVVGDWMPVKIFLNKNGTLVDNGGQAGLEKSNGWVNALATGDFNEDGLIDLVLGNHGINSRFRASDTEPLSLYINDFDKNGTVEQILTRFDRGKELPFIMRTDLLMQIPTLKKKYLRFGNYTGQGIADIFSDEQMANTFVLKAFDLTTRLLINKGNGTFESSPLPLEAQFAPVYAILAEDFDGDGHLDILLGGNQYRAKPETGIYDASYGLLLKGDGKGGFESTKPNVSGVMLKGQIRSFGKITVGKQRMVIVGKNNEKPEFISY